MAIRFLGTRGNIPIRSARHRRHSAILFERRGRRVLVDCGEDWLGRARRVRPTSILVTHGHPDHAGGLKHGAPCPVYATAATWRLLARWPVAVRGELPVRRALLIDRLLVEAWPVQHSLRAPAVGFRIAAEDFRVFYVPDVAALDCPTRALRGVDLYIGDGAAVRRPLVRRRGAVSIGHASVESQLDWCRAAGVARAVFTHCGSAIVRSRAGEAERIVEALGRARGVEASVADDGLVLRV